MIRDAHFITFRNEENNANTKLRSRKLFSQIRVSCVTTLVVIRKHSHFKTQTPVYNIRVNINMRIKMENK